MLGFSLKCVFYLTVILLSLVHIWLDSTNTPWIVPGASFLSAYILCKQVRGSLGRIDHPSYMVLMVSMWPFLVERFCTREKSPRHQNDGVEAIFLMLSLATLLTVYTLPRIDPYIRATKSVQMPDNQKGWNLASIWATSLIPMSFQIIAMHVLGSFNVKGFILHEVLIMQVPFLLYVVFLIYTVLTTHGPVQQLGEGPDAEAIDTEEENQNPAQVDVLKQRLDNHQPVLASSYTRPDVTDFFMYTYVFCGKTNKTRHVIPSVLFAAFYGTIIVLYYAHPIGKFGILSSWHCTVFVMMAVHQVWSVEARIVALHAKCGKREIFLTIIIAVLLLLAIDLHENLHLEEKPLQFNLLGKIAEFIKQAILKWIAPYAAPALKASYVSILSVKRYARSMLMPVVCKSETPVQTCQQDELVMMILNLLLSFVPACFLRGVIPALKKDKSKIAKIVHCSFEMIFGMPMEQFFQTTIVELQLENPRTFKFFSWVMQVALPIMLSQKVDTVGRIMAE